MAEAPGRVPPVQERASRHGYSADHFTRIFKTVIGQSPQAYLVRPGSMGRAGYCSRPACPFPRSRKQSAGAAAVRADERARSKAGWCVGRILRFSATPTRGCVVRSLLRRHPPVGGWFPNVERAIIAIQSAPESACCRTDQTGRETGNIFGTCTVINVVEEWPL
jgi:hypothetical protein